MTNRSMPLCPFQQAQRFHRTFELPMANQPVQLPDETPTVQQQLQQASAQLMRLKSDIQDSAFTDFRALRTALLLEEVAEYLTAEACNDLVAIADALGDIEAVINGTAVSYGIPLDQVSQAIYESNLSKLDANGRPIKSDGSDGKPKGKIIKSDQYQPPKLSPILYERNPAV